MRLIDADKLKHDVLDWEACYNGFSDAYDKARIIDAIDEQPTVDAEPVKHGHWTLNSMEHGVCSVCHQSSVDIVGGDWANYCPACGATMDEVNDEVN